MSTRSGEALVLAVKPFGERDALVELVCPERGRMRGLVKGGRSSRGGMAAVLQPFNTVKYEHFRRLDGQLGSLSVELAKSRAHVWLNGGAGGYVVAYLSELLREILPEEHPYDGLVAQVLALLGSGGWHEVILFELWLLEAVGYGLRLHPDEGVAGDGGAWAYVSPSSGRIVTESAARGWEGKLLALPACLGGPMCSAAEDLARAWRLTGAFLTRALHGKALLARGRLAEYHARTLADAKDAQTTGKGDARALAA